ncbi:MAG: hypothetical protein WBZ36_12095 [Candidatus Nitrosopolaris sp.]
MHIPTDSSIIAATRWYFHTSKGSVLIYQNFYGLRQEYIKTCFVLLIQNVDQKPQDQSREQTARKWAEEQLKGLNTESEIMDQLEKHVGDSPVNAQALREAAVVQLVSPEVESHTEHILKPFAAMLEPNPRSMKRLVNAYGIAIAIDILSGGGIERSKLALWTILTFRWPRLADYLEEHPKDIELILHKDEKSKGEYLQTLRTLFPNPEDKEMQMLFLDREVYDVVTGKYIKTQMKQQYPT